MRFLGIAVAFATLAPGATRAQPHGSTPSIRLLATGGTIASRDADNPLSAEQLLALVPEISGVGRVSAEQFANLASDQITPRDWLNLARRINQILEGDTDGVLVTHGTDTLEETAYFLNLTVRSPKPVVVVGAMRAATAVAPDGPANLLNAARVAASPESRGRGVLVVLNDEINAARDVTKTNTLRLDTFRSRTFGPLGTVDRGVVRFYRRVERLHTSESVFSAASLPDELPRVDIAYVYAGADGTSIDANVAKGAQGIVMAAVGAGGLTPDQREAIRRAVERRVVVAIASRTGAGVVADSPPGTLKADDLSAQKARILLMLALTQTRDPEKIQRLFDTY